MHKKESFGSLFLCTKFAHVYEKIKHINTRLVKNWRLVKNDKQYSRILLSLQEKQIAGIQVKELNEFLKNFINVYFSVGNLIPIWPGGNKTKGDQNKGFMDIPELYFTRYEAWYKLLTQHENAYLRGMTRYMQKNKEKLGSLKSFLNTFHSVEDYKKYVTHIVRIIGGREKAIS